MLHMQIRLTSESVLFLPLSFFALGEDNSIVIWVSFLVFCVAVANLVAGELGDVPIYNQGGVPLLFPSLLRFFV